MTAQAQQNVQPDDPLAVRLYQYLDVLHAWTQMFARMIEVFESRNFENFQVLIRSEDLAAVLMALFSLTANQANAQHQNSIISFCGLQRLDQPLNKIKTRAFESLNMLLDHTL